MADDEELPPQPQWEGPFNEDGLPHGQEQEFSSEKLCFMPASLDGASMEIFTVMRMLKGEDEEEEKPGDTFEGTMVAGVRHGPGKYVWSSGASFEGTYENNIREGKGYMVYPNKCTYKAPTRAEIWSVFKTDQVCLIVSKAADNQYAIAYGVPAATLFLRQWDFSNNVPHGVGLYAYSNGDMYMGQWKEGKRHGNGSYHFKKEGCQFIGEWADGSFVAGQWTFKDGTTFKGSFADFKPQGEGELTLARSRLRQQGAFVNGRWKGGPDIVVLPMLV